MINHLGRWKVLIATQSCIISAFSPQLCLDAALFRNLTKTGRLPGEAGEHLSHTGIKIKCLGLCTERRPIKFTCMRQWKSGVSCKRHHCPTVLQVNSERQTQESLSGQTRFTFDNLLSSSSSLSMLATREDLWVWQVLWVW